MAKILIVDDEPNIRLLYTAVLTEREHEVVEAENGRQALEALEREPFDLVEEVERVLAGRAARS